MFENYLFSASTDGTAKHWDKVTGRFVKSFSMDNSIQVTSIAVSEDGKFLFTGSQDTAAYLVQWRVSDGLRLQTLDGRNNFF
jgi:WD40 repeat protein